MVQRESNSTTDSCLYKILCWLVRPFLFGLTLARFFVLPFTPSFLLSILHNVFHLRTRSIITVHISSMLWHCHSHRLASSALCCRCCLPARICCFCGGCYCCCCCWRLWWWWSLLLLLLSSSSLSPSPSAFDGHHHHDDDIFVFFCSSCCCIFVCVCVSVCVSFVFGRISCLIVAFFTLFCFVLFLLLYFDIFLHSPFLVVIPFCWVNVKGGRRMGGNSGWQRYVGGEKTTSCALIFEREYINIVPVPVPSYCCILFFYFTLLYIKHQFSLLLTYYFISFVSPSISRFSILFVCFSLFFVPFIGHIYFILLESVRVCVCARA